MLRCLTIAVLTSLMAFLHISIAHAGSCWEYVDGPYYDEYEYVNYYKGAFSGDDQTFKCRCRVMIDTGWTEKFYRAQWTVKAWNAGFGCKSHCLGSAKWKEIEAKLMNNNHSRPVIERAKNSMWLWGTSCDHDALFQ